MRYEFINKTGSDRLILIFAGWGTDASFYSHIKLSGWDTLVVYDYSDLDFPEDVLDGYSTVALFAWSLGVFAAAMTVPFRKVALAVAVNGTEHPADDMMGIPEAVFDGTAANLSPRNLMKFQRRMAGKQYDGIANRLLSEDIDNLRRQLDFIRRASAVKNLPATRWQKVYVSDSDAIFPPSAQRRAWENHPSDPAVVSLDAPHYVDMFHIVKGSLPSSGKVADRFAKALPTYDSQASAQKEIAMHLADILDSHLGCDESRKQLENVLEIGPGSGMLTSRLVRNIDVWNMDFVDLYETGPFRVAAKESYHVADAEEWVAKAASQTPGKYDAIVSASAIQWFVNPARFFANAAILLKSSGILLFSTFLPGNLSELSAVNPHGLIYRNRKEIESSLCYCFKILASEESDIRLDFKSQRDLLLHLRHTGVGGSSITGKSLREICSLLPDHLTYRPLYILAVKR